jgi:hypothetical protein
MPAGPEPAAHTYTITAPLTSIALRRDPRFHRLTEHLHRLGPRPVGELLLEVAAGRDLIDALERYAVLDPASVARLGGRDWPPAVWRAA